MLSLGPAAFAATAEPRFVGQVTDTLRTPTHRLLAGSDGRALADLVFLDREQAKTSYRTCVVRIGKSPVRTCFTLTTAGAGTATFTPLRFQRGQYKVVWTVAGTVAARWRFTVL